MSERQERANRLGRTWAPPATRGRRVVPVSLSRPPRSRRWQFVHAVHYWSAVGDGVALGTAGLEARLRAGRPNDRGGGVVSTPRGVDEVVGSTAGCGVVWCGRAFDSRRRPAGRLTAGARAPSPGLLVAAVGLAVAPALGLAVDQPGRDRTATGPDDAGVGTGRRQRSNGLPATGTREQRRVGHSAVAIPRLLATHRDHTSRSRAASTLIASGDSGVVRDVYIPVE